MGVVALLLVIKGAPQKTAVRIPNLPRPRAARVGGAIILILWIQIPAATLAPGVARSGGGGPPPNIVLYYHGDHLGSTQVVTDQSGNIELQLRYDVYGKEIIRANASGNPIPASNKIKHEYTGHEREQVSGLFYAGARFLDPELAQFLTVDPAGEFASPFAYGPWDPINGSDPSGTSWLGGLLAAIVVSLVVYGAGQALYGIAVGIATGNAWAIIGSLAGIAFAVAGAVISPAAVGIGLVNATPSAQAFTAAGAGLGTYAAVQSWRGREVAWWTPIAGIAIGMAGLAYRAATSKSANGLAASSGGDEAADGLAKDQRRTVDWNNPDREATDTGRFRGPFPSDRATFQAANSEVLDQTLRSRTAGEWFFNVTADDKGYYYSPPRWWKGHHFMIENRPPALWYGHSHPISSSYSIIHPTDPSAGDFSGARNSGTPGVVVSAGAREYRVYSADYLEEYRGDLVRW